jgi:hypothetical protein
MKKDQKKDYSGGWNAETSSRERERERGKSGSWRLDGKSVGRRNLSE